MILDNQVLFSDAQAITAASLAASTNVIDLGAPGSAAYNNVSLRRRMDKGHTPLLIQVVEDFAGAATLINVKVQESVDAAFSSPVTLVEHDILAADLVAGYICPIDELPRNIEKRYLRIAYTPDGIQTAGKFTSGIVAAIDSGYKGNN